VDEDDASKDHSAVMYDEIEGEQKKKQQAKNYKVHPMVLNDNSMAAETGTHQRMNEDSTGP
jgi:hypothetical protein